MLLGAGVICSVDTVACASVLKVTFMLLCNCYVTGRYDKGLLYIDAMGAW